jgi:endonuclease III related protein
LAAPEADNPQHLIDDGRSVLPNVNEVLEMLEQTYGPLQAAGPTDPYEMIVYLNCGYPASDASCSKGFDALKREVGLNPKEILAAPKSKLAKLLRLGGIVPELRAARLQEIARKVKNDFGGDLKAVLKKRMQEEKQQTGKGIRAAKKVLKEFPVVGEPSAEKILLFSKLAPVAAVPSAFVEVPARLWFGKAGKNYSADYRAAREILTAGLAETFEARQRAYLLLKKHGQQTCKRSNPKCEVCPLTGQCAYIQLQAAGRNVV